MPKVLWFPITLILVAFVAVILGLLVGMEEKGPRETVAVNVSETLMKIAVILVLGAVASSFLWLCSHLNQGKAEGTSDGS